MALKYRSISGTNDILPPAGQLWHCLEEKARDLFYRYGYQEIRTPILENTELFTRSVGAHTDIVEKEMYTFADRDNKSVSLRPEETAGVVRAYLEGSLYAKKSLWKLFYFGPMFRRERPQAGRFRQFHQIGAEILGTNSPGADAETITWLCHYFKMFNLPDLQIKVNTAGCSKCRPGYTMRLKEELGERIKDMCPDCQRRYQRNIFRVLDCKQAQCREIIEKLPIILDVVCSECKDHFSELENYLSKNSIHYQRDVHLVRGLDYYTRTVYEFVSPIEGLGAQNTLAAGGRYDRLVQDMGGQSTGAVGFSIGVERLIMALDKLKCFELPDRRLQLYLISLDKESFELNYALLNELRQVGLRADIDLQQKSIKAQMRLANKMRARFVIVRGENERKDNVVILKDMDEGTEQKVKEVQIVDVLKKMLDS